MEIIIRRTESGLHIDLGTPNWNHYLVLGMLEQAKHLIHKEIDKMVDKQGGPSNESGT